MFSISPLNLWKLYPVAPLGPGLISPLLSRAIRVSLIVTENNSQYTTNQTHVKIIFHAGRSSLDPTKNIQSINGNVFSLSLTGQPRIVCLKIVTKTPITIRYL
jgi:hypothetical protein